MNKKSLQNTLHRFSQILWGLGIFSLPFSISVLLWQVPSSLQGSFNPYTSFSIYLSEGLILLAGLLWGIERLLRKQGLEKNGLKIGGILLLLSLIAIGPSQNPLSSLLNGIHVLVAFISLLLIQNELLSKQKLQTIFIGSIALQSVIAIGQVTLQHSIGLRMLGESWISTETPGVAKHALGEFTFIRGYGTLPHPNLLSAYTLVGLLFALKISWHKRGNEHWILKNLATAFIAIGFILSHSEAAFLAVLLVFILNHSMSKKRKQGWIGVVLAIAVGIILTHGGHESIHERWEYLKISLQMLIESPQGVGWHQFTERMQEFATIKFQPWQFQPVHNAYLLLMNELGLMGGAVAFMGIYKIGKRAWTTPKQNLLIIALMILALFDHYSVSLTQGFLLYTFALTLTLYSPKIDPTKSG